MAVPHLQPELGVVRPREHDGVGPPPRLEDEEELPEGDRRTCVGVELQDEGNGHVDVDPAPVSHLVRVESSVLGPLPYQSDDGQERLVPLLGPPHERRD